MSNLTCKDPQGGHLISYYLERSGLTGEFKMCPPNCLHCEEANKCLICQSGYIIIFDKSSNGLMCASCRNLVPGCDICSYWKFDETLGEISVEEVRLMADLALFELILLLKKARPVCKVCLDGFYLTAEAACNICSNKIPDCEGCVSLGEDNSIFDFPSFLKSITSNNSEINIICYRCQNISQLEPHRLTLSPLFDKCEACPEPSEPESMRAKECQYIFGGNEKFDQNNDFDLTLYKYFRMKNPEQFELKAISCPEESCEDSSKAVCISARLEQNCKACVKQTTNKEITCTSCDPGFFLDINGYCSPCLEGCLECQEGSKCIRCSLTHILDIKSKNCVKYSASSSTEDVKNCLSIAVIVISGRKQNFCIACMSGFYPTVRVNMNSFCQACPCVGCYEAYGIEGLNITSYITRANFITSKEDFDTIYNFFSNYFLSSGKLCTACNKLNQVSNKEGKCLNCMEGCEYCTLESDNPVCSECINIPFGPGELALKNLMRTNYSSPVMLYLFSESYFSSIGYLVSNKANFSSFANVSKYVREAAIFYSINAKHCQPCPFGCLKCERLSPPISNHLQIYESNCTECRPGFIADKLNDLIICRFCADMDSCLVSLRLKFLVTCSGGQVLDRDLYPGYIEVADIDDLLGELNKLSISALINMNNEAYLQLLDISIFFKSGQENCVFSKTGANFKLAFELSNLAIHLKFENAFLYVGSYEVTTQGAGPTINTATNAKAKIFIKSVSPTLELPQFGNIVFENVAFLFGPSFSAYLNFFFVSCTNFTLRRVEFLGVGYPASSADLLFYLKEATSLQVEDLRFENIIISNSWGIFAAPKLVLISFLKVAMLGVKFENGMLVLSGSDVINVTLNEIVVRTAELKNFLILQLSLTSGVARQFLMNQVSIENTSCPGSGLIIIIGFNSVSINSLRIVSSNFSYMIKSFYVNSLVACDLIPNITAVEINHNLFKDYRLVYKLTEDEGPQQGAEAFFGNWSLVNNIIIHTEAISSPASFLIECMPLIQSKNESALSLEGFMLLNNRLWDDAAKNSDLSVIFLRIENIARVDIKYFEQTTVGVSYFLGAWELRGVGTISFLECIFRNQIAALESGINFERYAGFLKIKDAVSVVFDKVDFSNILFYESLISITNTNAFYSSLKEWEIKFLNSSFKANGLFAEEFISAGLIKIAVFSKALVVFNETVFFENFLNKVKVFYTGSASCLYIDSFSARVYVQSSKFERNTASNIYFFSEIFDINSSEFSHNSGETGFPDQYNPSSQILGGFIEGSCFSFVINFSNFTDGKAFMGGAIYFSSLQESLVTIDNTIFSNIYTLNRGGALFFDLEKSIWSKIYITSVNVTGTFSGEQGGFIYIKASFSQNSSIYFRNITVDGALSVSKGSFLSSSLIEIYVQNSKWIQEESSKSRLQLVETIGNALGPFFGLKSLLSEESMTIASLFSLGQTNAMFENCSFENINFGQDPAAVIISAEDSNLYFSSSLVEGVEFSERGIIDGLNCNFTISKSDFINLTGIQQEDLRSSPIRCENCAEINLSNVNVAQIQCPNCKGGFLMVLSAKLGVYIAESVFYNISLSNMGGVIYSENSHLYLTSSLYSGIESETKGGVLLSLGMSSMVNISSCSFRKTFAAEGGVIFMEYGNLSIFNSEFSSSLASNWGGAIYGFGCDTIINGAKFRETFSGMNGGSLYIEGSSKQEGKLIIAGSYFFATKANYFGGAVYISLTSLRIKDCRFSSSSKYDRSTDPTSNLLSGGILYMEEVDSNITDSYFSESESFEGGLIMALGAHNTIKKFFMSSCNLTNADVAGSGGALNLQNLNADIRDCLFLNFSSGAKGGIIFCEGETKTGDMFVLEIQDSKFVSSKSLCGGGLMISYMAVKIRMCSFEMLASVALNNLRILLAASKNRRKLQEVQIEPSKGGAIFASNSIINMSSTSFFNCSAGAGGAIHSEESKTAVCFIAKCEFMFNMAKRDGGALSFEETLKITITETNFLQNTAGFRGGGIYYFSLVEAKEAVEMILNKVLFQSNTAQIGGAMSYYNPVKGYVLQDVVLLDNKASNFGSEFTSTSKSMRMTVVRQTENGSLPILNEESGKSYFSSGEFNLEQYRSGAMLEYLLVFELLDENGEVIKQFDSSDDFSARISIQDTHGLPNSSYIVTAASQKESLKVGLVNNTFLFENLKIIGSPATKAFLTVTCDQIRTNNESESAYIKGFAFTIKIAFRECINGEYRNPLGTCDVCQEGSFSLTPSETCKKCPADVESCHGAVLQVQPGFWRSSEDSELILACGSKSHCVGGNGTGNDLCGEGLVGALCSSCDIYKTHWPEPFTKSGSSCAKCENITLNLLSIILVALMKIILTYSSIQGVVEMCDNETSLRLLRKFYSKGAGKLFVAQYNYTAFYIKIFLNYITILGFISSFGLSIDYPVVESFRVVSFPLNFLLYSLDCYTIEITKVLKGFHIIYFKIIMTTLMPLALLCLFLIIYYIIFLLKFVAVQLKRIIFTTVIFIVIFLQPSIVEYLFSVLGCTRIGDKLYILADKSLECYSTEHLQYGLAIGLPVAFIWILVIPFFFLRRLWLIRKHLDIPSFFIKYGFLYSEYKTANFYWEFIKVFVKLLMMGILSFFDSQIIIKGLLLLLLLSFYFFILIKINPYKFKELYSIDIISSGLCFISILFALLCYQNPYLSFIYFNYAIIGLVNIIFSAFCLYEIFKTFLKRFNKKLQEFAIKVINRAPFLEKCFHRQVQQHRIDSNWRLLKVRIYNYLRALDILEIKQTQGEEMSQRALTFLKNRRESRVMSFKKHKKLKRYRIMEIEMEKRNLSTDQLETLDNHRSNPLRGDKCEDIVCDSFLDT